MSYVSVVMERRAWRVLTGAVSLVASLGVLAACGDTTSRSPEHPRPSTDKRQSQPSGARLDAELVAVDTTTHVMPRRRPPDVIIDERGELSAYLGFFAGRTPDTARKLRAKLPERLPKGNVLVALTTGLGCSMVSGAQLVANGSDLKLRFANVTHLPECVVAWDAVAVFAVPAAELPKNVTLDGRRSREQADPGRRLLMAPLGNGSAGEVDSAEISKPDQLARFVAEVPAVEGKVRKAARQRRPENTRLFAFVTSSGCFPGGMLLVVKEERITVAAARPELDCPAVYEPHVAVYALKTYFVPEDVSVGRD